MEEISLGKQFFGLNCINYDMFKEVAVDFRAQTEKKMGRDVKRLNWHQRIKIILFCLSLRARLTSESFSLPFTVEHVKIPNI